MPSEFDLFAAEFVAPTLVHGMGQPGNLTIVDSASGESVELSAIITQPEYDVEPDLDNNELHRVERSTAVVDRAEMDAKKITRLELGGVLTVNGEKWNWDQSTTRWGEPMRTIGLKRTLLTQKPGPRNANL